MSHLSTDATSEARQRLCAADRLVAALGGAMDVGVGTIADVGSAEPLLTVNFTEYQAHSKGDQAGDVLPVVSAQVYELVLDDGPEQGASVAFYPGSQKRNGCTLGPCQHGDGSPENGAVNERNGLARRRMWRTLAPQSLESPVFLHLTDSSPAALHAAVDQCAEAGFEMIIYSFGSGFQLESRDATYVALVKANIDYAQSKGIEVGAYGLISWTRDPGSYNTSWSCVDPTTGKKTGNAFFGKGWSSYLTDQILWFANATGLSMVETDGPYAGYECVSADPVGDPGTVRAQAANQARMYERLRSAGIFINAPGFCFASGINKEGIGYIENTFSLPRPKQNERDRLAAALRWVIHPNPHPGLVLRAPRRLPRRRLPGRL